MNYRHHFHAGNFADVMKHALLVQLVRALQKKEKGFLYLDTHAGRGAYDLTVAATGDTLARSPEWPEGIGRLWRTKEENSSVGEFPNGVGDYVELVRSFDRRGGNTGLTPRYYPGSPSLVSLLARPQDRLMLCERQPAEAGALKENFQFQPDISVQVGDGYGALRAMLPPREKRALVLIDPPFEAQDEWARIVKALHEGLQRFPSGVYAIWYPLTERAKVDSFFRELMALELPPTVALELAVNPVEAKMKGCGLVVVNPPWKFTGEAEATLQFLAGALAHGAGARADAIWLVSEK